MGGRCTGFFAVLLVAFGFSAAGGHAQTTTTGVTLPSEANCGQKQLTFLWWPAGHGASQQYNFPAFPLPHVEVYKGSTTTFSEDAFLAYFDDHGEPHFEPACKPVSSSAKPKAITSKKSQTGSAVLVCKFTKTPTLQVITGTDSATMNAIVSNEVAASLKLGQNGALTYNSTVCKAKPPLIPA